MPIDVLNASSANEERKVNREESSKSEARDPSGPPQDWKITQSSLLGLIWLRWPTWLTLNP